MSLDKFCDLCENLCESIVNLCATSTLFWPPNNGRCRHVVVFKYRQPSVFADFFICEFTYSHWQNWSKMTIFKLKLDFLSANSGSCMVQNDRTYLPWITSETCSYARNKNSKWDSKMVATTQRRYNRLSSAVSISYSRHGQSAARQLIFGPFSGKRKSKTYFLATQICSKTLHSSS